MGDTVTADGAVKTRPRSGNVSTSGKAPGRESPIVTNLLTAVGGNAKSAAKDTAPDKGKAEGPTAKNIEAQKKYWADRIRLVTEAIGADLSVLEMMPGMQDVATSWKDKLKQAALPQKENQWKESHSQLATVQGQLHDYVQQQRTGSLNKLNASVKERKEYERMHSEIAEKRSKIAEYPDGEAIGKALIDREVAKAERSYAADNFARALEQIKQVHTDATEKLKTLNDRDNDCKGVTSPFGTLYETLGKLDKLIGEKADIVGEHQVQSFADESRQIYKEMLDAVAGGTGSMLGGDKRKALNEKSKQFTARAKDIETRLNTAVSETEGKATAFTQQIQAIETKISNSAETQSAAAVNEVYEQLLQARSEAAARKYDEALETASSVADAVAGWNALPPAGNARSAAVVAAGKKQFKEPAEAQLAIAKALAADAKTCPVLDTPPMPSATVTNLDLLLEQFADFPEAFPVGEGIDAVKRAKDENAANQKRKQDYTALSSKREELTKQITAAAELVTEYIDEFKEGASQISGAEVKRLPTYEKKRDDLLQQWEESAKRATELGQLPFDVIKQQFELLQKSISSDAGKEKEITSRIAEGRIADLNTAFAEASRTAAAAADALTEVNYEKGDAQRQLFDAAADRYAACIKRNNYDGAQTEIDLIAKIGVAAKNEADKAAQSLNDMKYQWRQWHTGVSNDLRKLEEQAKARPYKDYTGAIAAMRAEHEMIGTVNASQDTSVFEASIRDLRGLGAEVDALGKLFTKFETKVAPGPTDLTIKNLEDRADRIAKPFSDKQVDRMEKDALAEIKAKHKAITDAIGTDKLADSDRKLTELAQEWTELKARAEAGENGLIGFRTEVDKEIADLRTWPDAVNFPDYARSIQARLLALKNGPEDRDGLTALKKEFAETSIHTQTLQRANDRAQTEKLADEIAAKAWKADYAAFQGKLKSLDLIKKGIDDPEKRTAFQEQADQIKSAAAELSKSEGKTSYQSMGDQLRALVTNVNNLINYPMGLETHARGQIMPTVRDWDAAVGKFHEELAKLPDAVGKAMGPDPQAGAVVVAVRVRVAKASEALVANTITPMASAVEKAGKDIVAAREAREMALREVKRLQRIVVGAAFKPFAENAFDVDVLTALGNLSARLFDVETNLIISL